MKKNITIIFLLVVLVGCSVNPNNEKDSHNTFKNKQECLKYKDEVEKGGDYLDELFYSIKLNTCISVTHSPGTGIYAIRDVLSGEWILMKLTNGSKPNLEGKTKKEFEDKIKELKGK